MKTQLIFLAIFMLLTGLVMADYDAIVVSPLNNTIQSTSVTFQIKTSIPGTANCKFFTTANSTDLFQSSSYTWSSVTNNTMKTYALSLLPNSPIEKYYWNVNCSSITNSSVWNITNNSFFVVDNVYPYIGLNIPTSTNTRSTIGNITVNITAYDMNPDKCVLYGTINTSSNTTLPVYVSLNTQSYSNGVTVQFSEPIQRDLADGTYNFYLLCNDTSNYITNSTSFSVQVSHGATQGVNCKTPLNNSYHTKLTTFTWNAVTNSAFAFYNLTVTTGSTSTSYIIRNNSTVTKELTLTGNSAYTWSIDSYDVAGNANKTGNCSTLRPRVLNTVNICSNLLEGWNVCGWESDVARNLSAIASDAGATYVSTWNYSSNSFTSYVGTTVNAGVSVSKGAPIWVYKSTAGSWEQQWTQSFAIIKTELVNTSGISNLPIAINNISGYTLKVINDNINATCGWMGTVTLVNQTNSRYYNFMCGFNESSTALAPFGSVVWIDFNETAIPRFNVSV